MRSRQWLHAIALGALLAVAALAYMVGAAVAGCVRSHQALAEMEGCAGLKNEAVVTQCVDAAYMKLRVSRGGR